MNESPDWFVLIMGLSGGLAIFLIGMDRTVSGLKGIAGNRLRWILSHLTRNRWYGAATGAGITPSSSLRASRRWSSWASYPPGR